MFEQIAAPDHVLAYRFSGKLGSEDVEKCKSLFEPALKRQGRFSLYCDFTALTDISAKALAGGVKADLEFFSHSDRLARFAVVSDKEWPGAFVAFIAPVIPTFEMKVFAPLQKDEALKWASVLPAAQTAKKPAIRFIPTTRDDVIGFEINGVISTEDLPGVTDKVNGFLAAHDKVRMLARVKHLGGFDPAVFFQSGLFSMKLAAMQKVERYAIVGAPVWMNKAVQTMNPMFPHLDMRPFPAAQEDEAWAWLDARPAG